MKRLRVSDNRRFLTHDDGTPFFYLGDTAWELFHRLNRNDAELYLEDRAAKGFTVIQAVVLAELDGLHAPNAYGDCPLRNDDPTQPEASYFQHVDFVVNRAEALGLHIGMLPTWGDKWNHKWGAGPEIFTSENAFAYGEFLGRRYAEKPVIWILGGDRPVELDDHRAVIRAMANGLREGDDGNHLITFHPQGGQTSAQHFHDEQWLDFNMWQTGHERNRDSYNCIASDYGQTPTKPCMDAEPGYEDHPAGFKLENGYLDEYDCRKSAYWALFAGAHGHTYGCHPVWQMKEADRAPLGFCRHTWREVLNLPGSWQMRHAKNLLLSRPFLTRIPDQTLITSENKEGAYHVRATRHESGSYALVYLPYYNPVEIDLERLSGERIAAYWYNPRNGTARYIGEFPRSGLQSFTPPLTGPDWLLVLEDAAREFSLPGSAPYPASKESSA